MFTYLFSATKRDLAGGACWSVLVRNIEGILKEGTTEAPHRQKMGVCGGSETSHIKKGEALWWEETHCREELCDGGNPHCQTMTKDIHMSGLGWRIKAPFDLNNLTGRASISLLEDRLQ